MAHTKAKKAKAPKKIQTAGALEKKNIKSRTDCSSLVGTKGPASALWAAQAAVTDSGQKLVSVGLSLDKADAAAIKADADALAAHSARDALVVEWDAAFDVYAANVTRHATTPGDVTDVGLAVHVRASHALAPPLAVHAKLVGSMVEIRVTPAPGLKSVEIQISPTPADATSWKRVKGNGLKRTVHDLPPGTYAVRACSVRADDESELTAPVTVVVK